MLIKWESLFRRFKIRIFHLEMAFELKSYERYAILFYAKPRYEALETCVRKVWMFFSRKKAVESAWRIFNETLPEIIDGDYYRVAVFDTFDERFGEEMVAKLECNKGFRSEP